jgi:two-component system sensor histidine kinase MtrB
LQPRLVLAFVLVAFTTGAAAVALAAWAFTVYRQRGYGEPVDVDLLVFRLTVTVLLLLAFTVALALVAARRVLRPVRRLARAADRLAHGNLAIRLAVRGDDEMADLTRTFNAMASALAGTVEELRRRETQSRRFVADVSHELRTPLAAMTAVADLLAEEGARLPGDVGAAAQLVSRETRNLNRLVDDLVEISRFDASTAVLRLEDVDLAAAVRDCLELRGWSRRVSTHVPDDLLIRVDPRRLDVILANLVGNALAHGAPPVEVVARTEAGPDGDRVLALSISDHGPGLGHDVLPHVFDRFYKADTARTRSDGSGLGLAIALENARLHDGSIQAADRPGGGAVFTVWLPLRPPPDGKAAPEAVAHL